MKRQDPVKVSIQIESAYRTRIGARQLKLAARLALQHHHLSGDTPVELTIVIAGDERVHALNRQYRGVDASTDVLAFAAGVSPAGFVQAPGEPAYLGDVIISYPQAQAQAQAEGHPVEAELQLLVVHGVLHLLGHDHASAAQKRKMWAAQAEILQLLGLPPAIVPPLSKRKAPGVTNVVK